MHGLRALLLAGCLMALSVPALAHLRDFEVFTRSTWKVQPKTDSPRRFVLNAAQKIVYYEMRKMRESGRPVRIKVLKARQQGVSTMACAYAQFRCSTRHGFNAISIADKLKLPQQWLERGKRWYKQQPEGFRPHLAKSNTIELYFDGLASRYSIGSMLGQTPGMGETIHCFHPSELSSWNNAEAVMADVMPSVPKNSIETDILMESTGEMVKDFWHNQVMLTLDGGDAFVLVFLPWFISEDYRLPVNHPDLPEVVRVENYDEDEKDLCALAEQWAKKNPVHARLAGFTGITPEHIAFRRWTIPNEFSGDVERFKSRYPATISEAFLGIGALAMPLQIVRHHAATSSDDFERVTLRREGDKVVADPYTGPLSLPHWQVWHKPVERFDYALGGDTCSGKRCDPDDERSELDWATIYVLNRHQLRFDAAFRGHVPGDVLGDEMVKGAIYFNHGWIAPEVNNTGQAAIVVVRDYPRVMRRPGAPDNLADKDINKYGWETTGGNRDLLLDEYIAACRAESGSGFDGKLIVLDEGLANEEATFVYTKLGKREHRRRCFDDRIIAAAITWQVHKRCPRSFGESRLGGKAALDALAATVHAQPAPRPDAFPGGADPCLIEDESDNDGGITL